MEFIFFSLLLSMNEDEEVEAANFLNLKRKVIFREIQLAK